jgi:beta-ribofuranosylaminobenzene 5'-phosphate synthase
LPEQAAITIQHLMPSAPKISVTAPARLHMGFIDLSGSLGRHFGSIGIALNEINTRLTLSIGQRQILGPSAQRAERCLTQLCQAMNVSDQVKITIEAAIPEHVGLGSGTQMALAIGTALNAHYGLGLTVREIASVMDRGLRSGIGIGVFEHGGLVIDGGRGEKTITPPVLVHLDMPTHWRFILVFDQRGQGLHGEQEIAAFKKLPTFPPETAERFCYLLLMQGLPAVAEHDLNQFGQVISKLQTEVGKHFAPAQGGIYASDEVAQAMAWLERQGAVALGQTSWGPTGFCAFESTELAEAIFQEAEAQFVDLLNLSFAVVSANNEKGDSRLVLANG